MQKEILFCVKHPQLQNYKTLLLSEIGYNNRIITENLVRCFNYFEGDFYGA